MEQFSTNYYLLSVFRLLRDEVNCCHLNSALSGVCWSTSIIVIIHIRNWWHCGKNRDTLVEQRTHSGSNHTYLLHGKMSSKYWPSPLISQFLDTEQCVWNPYTYLVILRCKWVIGICWSEWCYRSFSHTVGWYIILRKSGECVRVCGCVYKCICINVSNTKYARAIVSSENVDHH